jgi:hypothetical protein
MHAGEVLSRHAIANVGRVPCPHTLCLSPGDEARTSVFQEIPGACVNHIVVCSFFQLSS